PDELRARAERGDPARLRAEPWDQAGDDEREPARSAAARRTKGRVLEPGPAAGLDVGDGRQEALTHVRRDRGRSLRTMVVLRRVEVDDRELREGAANVEQPRPAPAHSTP